MLNSYLQQPWIGCIQGSTCETGNSHRCTMRNLGSRLWLTATTIDTVNRIHRPRHIVERLRGSSHWTRKSEGQRNGRQILINVGIKIAINALINYIGNVVFVVNSWKVVTDRNFLEWFSLSVLDMNELFSIIIIFFHKKLSDSLLYFRFGLWLSYCMHQTCTKHEPNMNQTCHQTCQQTLSKLATWNQKTMDVRCCWT